MQRLATGMLITMLAVLVLANVFLSLHPSVGYLRAFAEAAVVGALADWFAVTALFRQPLGLPIPHTAIVPRNKERIGEALGRFVEHNFASPEIVSSKLAGSDICSRLARWLSDPQRTEAIAGHVTRLVPQLLDSVDDQDVSALSRAVWRMGPNASILGHCLGKWWPCSRRKSGTRYCSTSCYAKLTST